MATYQPPQSERPSDQESPQERGITVGVLFRHLAEESADLLRAELSLFRQEVDEKVTQAQRGILAMATGGAVLFAGFLILCTTACVLLAAFVPFWLASLIVGGVLVIIGAAMLGGGKRSVKASRLRPARSITELRRTQHDVKEHLQ